MDRILIIAVGASLFSVSAMADPSPAEGPRPGTTEAVQCLNRQGLKGCETMFVGQARLMARFWVVPNPNRDALRGSFVSSTYAGRATGSNSMDARVLADLPTKDMDIFHVKFTRDEYTFYVAPPDADRKIHALAGPGIPQSPNAW